MALAALVLSRGRAEAGGSQAARDQGRRHDRAAGRRRARRAGGGDCGAAGRWRASARTGLSASTSCPRDCGSSSPSARDTPDAAARARDIGSGSGGHPADRGPDRPCAGLEIRRSRDAGQCSFSTPMIFLAEPASLHRPVPSPGADSSSVWRRTRELRHATPVAAQEPFRRCPASLTSSRSP